MVRIQSAIGGLLRTYAGDDESEGGLQVSPSPSAKLLAVQTSEPQLREFGRVRIRASPDC